MKKRTKALITGVALATVATAGVSLGSLNAKFYPGMMCQAPYNNQSSSLTAYGASYGTFVNRSGVRAVYCPMVSKSKYRETLSRPYVQNVYMDVYHAASGTRTPSCQFRNSKGNHNAFVYSGSDYATAKGTNRLHMAMNAIWSNYTYITCINLEAGDNVTGYFHDNWIYD